MYKEYISYFILFYEGFVVMGLLEYFVHLGYYLYFVGLELKEE